MKRLLIILLISIFILSMTACSAGNNYSTNTTQTTNTDRYTQPPADKKLTKSEAEEKAVQYFRTWINVFISPNIIEKARKEIHKSFAKVEITGIGSTDAVYSSTFDAYDVTIKGRFAGYDEYGKLEGIYNYSVTIRVSNDGKAELMEYSTHVSK